MKIISIFSKDQMILDLIGEDIQQFGNFLFTKSYDKELFTNRLDVSYSTLSELQDILNVSDEHEADFTEF